MFKDGHMEKGKRNKMLVSLHHTNTKPFPAEIFLDWVNANCAAVLDTALLKMYTEFHKLSGNDQSLYLINCIKLTEPPNGRYDKDSCHFCEVMNFSIFFGW